MTEMNVEFFWIFNGILFSLFVFNILRNNAIEKGRHWFLANLCFFFYNNNVNPRLKI